MRVVDGGRPLEDPAAPSFSRSPTRRSPCCCLPAHGSGTRPLPTVSVWGAGGRGARALTSRLAVTAPWLLGAGMTLEMVGTLLGAALHGWIVAGANASESCGDEGSHTRGTVSQDVVSLHCSPGDPHRAAFLPSASSSGSHTLATPSTKSAGDPEKGKWGVRV